MQHFIPLLLLAPSLPQDAPPVSFALLAAPEALTSRPTTGPELPPGGIPLWGPEESSAPLESRTAMPLEDWRRWIEEQAANRHRSLRLRSAGGGILVQGPAAEVAALVTFAREVEQLVDALTVELHITVRLGEGEAARQSGSVASGGQAAFGEIRRRGFVGGWRSEIAADSAVAEPEIWTAETGWALFVHASHQATGDGLLLAGSFSHSSQTGSNSFDPETPDLGLIEQPELDFSRVEFAQSIRPGKSVELIINRGGQTLTVTIEAQWTPTLPRPGAWSVIETAGLWPDLAWTDTSLLENTWPPSSIASILVAAGIEGTPLWAGSLLLIPPGDGTLESKARQLIQALGGQARQATLQAQIGSDTARVPASQGLPLGIQFSRITTAMTGYRAHLATDAWIAEPEVQTLVHGTTLSGRQAGGSTTLVWSQRHLQDRGLMEAPQMAYLGSLEWIAEEHRSGKMRMAGEGPGTQVQASSPHDLIHCQLTHDDSR